MLRKVLELTEEQVSQLDALREELKAIVAPLREERMGLRRGLRAELELEEPSALRVGELVISRHEVGQEIRAARQDFRESFRAILTPEQLDKLERFMKNRRGRRGFPRCGRSQEEGEF